MAGETEPGLGFKLVHTSSGGPGECGSVWQHRVREDALPYRMYSQVALPHLIAYNLNLEPHAQE